MQKIVAAAVLGIFGAIATAHADPLTDLRATLGCMQGRGAIHAEIDVKRSSKETGNASPKTDGHATLTVCADAQGLDLAFAPKLLEHAAHEAAAKAANPDLSSPIGDVLQEVMPAEINDLVGFAPRLLRKIDGATLKESRADTFDPALRRPQIPDQFHHHKKRVVAFPARRLAPGRGDTDAA